MHRSIEECKVEIAKYEEALQEMTADEYKQKSGISKQQIERIRKKVKKLQQKEK